jgi:hypothetical protein
MPVKIYNGRPMPGPINIQISVTVFRSFESWLDIPRLKTSPKKMQLRALDALEKNTLYPKVDVALIG